jgi:signal transduction histidine kinase
MLLFPDKEEKYLVVFASRGFNESGIGAKTPFGQGIIGMVAMKKKKIRIAGISKYRQYAYTAANNKGIAKDGIRLPGLSDLDSQLAIPLLANDELIAVLSIESSDNDYFTKEDENFLQSLSQQMALSIQNAIIIDRLEEKVTRRTREIEIQRAELERLNATKDRFFSIIGHDLKSPVSSLKVATDLIQHYTKKGETKKLSEVGLKVSTAVDNVNQLLDNLINWSMSQRELIKCEPKNIAVKAVLSRVEEIYKESILAKDIRFDNQLSDDCIVFADLNMTMTVFRNVLGNAIKFSNRKGIISITSTCKTSVMKIVITDNGVGIPAEKLDYLFELRDKKSTLGTNREKGTGLGMVLVKDFMELNEGSVSIESKLNEGTSVTLYFQSGKV